MTGWEKIGGPPPPILSVGGNVVPVSCVSRNPTQLDVFIIGDDGQVYTNHWDPNQGWQPGPGERESWLTSSFPTLTCLSRI
jgi:hypothetical protein